MRQARPELRNPKSEGGKKAEFRTPNQQATLLLVPSLLCSISGFGF
jgi:hypothetical protein